MKNRRVKSAEYTCCGGIVSTVLPVECTRVGISQVEATNVMYACSWALHSLQVNDARELHYRLMQDAVPHGLLVEVRQSPDAPVLARVSIEITSEMMNYLEAKRWIS